MGPTVRTLLLGLLCLLLAPAGASQEGEICLGFPPFHCPQRPDGTDGRFCCGSCLAPYCCDSEEARTDQNKCLHVWKMLESCDGVFTNPLVLQFLETNPTSDPKIRRGKSSGGDTTPAPWTWDNLTPTEVAAIVLSFALIVPPVLLICKCCGCSLRPGKDAPSNLPMVVQCDHSDSSDSIPPLEVYDSSPPYEDRPEESPPLPSCSQANPSTCSSDQHRVAVWPKRLPFTVLWPEEATFVLPPLPGATSTNGSTGESASSGEESHELEASVDTCTGNCCRRKGTPH